MGHAAVSTPPSRAAAFGILALCTLAAVLAIAIIGYFPTHNLAGTDGVSSMLVGIAIAFVAALAGLVPPVVALQRPPIQRQPAIMMGAAVRILVTLTLMLAATFSAGVHRPALLIWTAIGYMVLLAVDTFGVVWLFKRMEKPA